MLAGRLSTGGVVSAAGGAAEAWIAKADIGELAKREPVAQLAGRAPSVPCKLVWVRPPPAATSRNRTVPVAPEGARTAIQYRCPAVTAAEVTATSLKAPRTGAVMVAWVSSAPGLFAPVSAYRPTTTRLAVLVASR